MRLYTTPAWLHSLYPSLTWQVPTAERVLYLTFDDGPMPGPTDFVLEALDKHRAKATFFVVGDNVVKHPKTLQAVAQAGHSLGNHTHNHLKGWSTPNQTYYLNIEQADAALHQVLGADYNVRLFRPPYGRIAPSQIGHLQARYQVVMWSLLTCDFDRTLAPTRCLEETYRRLTPGQVIVFHDSHKAFGNLRVALPALLTVGVQEGWQFKAL